MNTERLLTEANTFISMMYNELQYSQAQLEERLASVSESVSRTGSYFQTEEELQYGAKVAWRNNSRCIGRLFWKSLMIADCKVQKLFSSEYLIKLFKRVVPTPQFLYLLDT